MIVSHALLSVMADGLFAAMNELISTGGPDVMLGVLAIVTFAVLAAAAALRADLTHSTGAGKATAMSMPVVQASPRAAAALSSSARAVKNDARSVRKPDGRVRFKPLPVPTQTYRRCYLPELSPQPRLIPVRERRPGGLSRFAERRASAKRLVTRAG